MSEWFTQWTEQQRRWLEAAQAAALMPASPFAGIAEAMAKWVDTAALPRDTLGGAVPWQAPASMAEALLGRIEDGPALAPLWDFDRKAAAANAAWWRLQQANQRYRQLVDSVWPKVQQAALARRSESGKDEPSNIRTATHLWLAELDRCLLELMRTPDYLQAQRETLDAGLALHEKLGDIAAELCELLHLPSREEVDDLARTVTELRRELRAVRRPAAAVPAAKVSASRGRTRKSDSWRAAPRGGVRP